MVPQDIPDFVEDRASRFTSLCLRTPGHEGHTRQSLAAPHSAVLSSEQLKLCKELPSQAKQSRDVATALSCSSLRALGWHPGKTQSQGAASPLDLWHGTVHSYLLLWSKETQKGQCLFQVFPNSHKPQNGLLQHPCSRESCCASPCLGICGSAAHSLLYLPSTSILHLQWCPGLVSIWEGCRQASGTHGGKSGRRVRERR